MESSSNNADESLTDEVSKSDDKTNIPKINKTAKELQKIEALLTECKIAKEQKGANIISEKADKSDISKKTDPQKKLGTFTSNYTFPSHADADNGLLKMLHTHKNNKGKKNQTVQQKKKNFSEKAEKSPSTSKINEPGKKLQKTNPTKVEEDDSNISKSPPLRKLPSSFNFLGVCPDRQIPYCQIMNEINLVDIFGLRRNSALQYGAASKKKVQEDSEKKTNASAATANEKMKKERHKKKEVKKVAKHRKESRPK